MPYESEVFVYDYVYIFLCVYGWNVAGIQYVVLPPVILR